MFAMDVLVKNYVGDVFGLLGRNPTFGPRRLRTARNHRDVRFVNARRHGG